MSILEEIQSSAVDGRSDLGALLRKCKVLAARLRSRPLEDWLLWESNGYPLEVNVPDYRSWPMQLKGHFFGPFNSELRNAPIPSLCVPERFRSQFETFECKQSVSAIESSLKSETTLYHVSTGNLAPLLGTKVYQGQNCIQAWGEFSSTNLVEVLNSVRNRILDFALAMWKEAPEAGEAGPQKLSPIEPNSVTQIFQTTVYGGTATLVGAAADSSFTNNTTGDFSGLQLLLKDAGLPEHEINELKQAIDADGEPKSSGQLGPKVSTWLSGVVKKAAEGLLQSSVTTVGKIAIDALSKYYGFS
jgi:hypothetical protein